MQHESRHQALCDYFLRDCFELVFRGEAIVERVQGAGKLGDLGNAWQKEMSLLEGGNTLWLPPSGLLNLRVEGRSKDSVGDSQDGAGYFTFSVILLRPIVEVVYEIYTRAERP